MLITLNICNLSEYTLPGPDFGQIVFGLLVGRFFENPGISLTSLLPNLLLSKRCTGMCACIPWQQQCCVLCCYCDNLVAIKIQDGY